MPSGDQSGSESYVELVLVRLACPLPSAFMTKMSSRHKSPPLKAILAPSGDQAGAQSSRELFVKLVWSLPSGFMAKIS